MKNNIEFLNFAKGSAILWIVIFHLLLGNVYGLWSKLIYLGGSGVHLFFLVSGFGLSLSEKNYSLIQFYEKRFIKILVPYYITVLLIFSLDYFFELYPKGENSRSYILLGHLLLYKMFDNTIIASYGGHLWFMSTLIQLYLLFPLIQKVQSHLSKINFILVSLTVSIIYWVLISYLHSNNLRVVNSVFLNYLWEFNLGMVMAEYFKSHKVKVWEIDIKYSFLISIVAFVVMGVITTLFGEIGKSFNDIPSLLGILYFTIFLYNLSKNHIGKLVIFFNFIGSISYELYLTHILTITIINKIVSFFLDVNIYLLLFYIPLILLVAFGFSLSLKKLQLIKLN